MSKLPSSPPGRGRCRLSRVEREEAIHLYESGIFNGVQLAHRYCVHRDVVYRYLRSRGAVKGRLAQPRNRKLEAELDVRDRRRQIAKRKGEEARLDAFIRSGAAVEQFMKALLRADREGKLAEFGRQLPRA